MLSAYTVRRYCRGSSAVVSRSLCAFVDSHCALLNHWNLDLSRLDIDVSPVLIRRCVKHVVLEIYTIQRQNSNRILSTTRKIDLATPSRPVSSRNISRYVYSYGIVERSVPGWRGVLLGISSQVC